ncbi:MAG: class I SAM-dependent methyltransferase [Pseudomonadota bacterium]
MKFEAEYVEVVDKVIDEIGGFDLRPDNSTQTEDSTYLRRHRHEYLRTVQDVDRYFEGRRDRRVFEIGAFFGVVSIALKRLGYDVVASDAPEFMEIPEQIERFGREEIAIDKMRLQDFQLNGADEAFDCVIMCEVLEHLNFNPLPLLKDINRVLSLGGLFYLSLPNQAQIRNRLGVLRGRALGIDAASFYAQLRPGSNEVVYGHWREYTMQDVLELTGPLGFESVGKYYFSYGETDDNSALRKRAGRLFYKMLPQLKENQTHLLRKRERVDLPFTIPGTVHPTLRSM